ncbi:MAG: Nif3-like dinuclear metal center hexameric protein [Prevotellaceae bacterium]|jgi:dinuclear metal center YbgI/SA1388 family protein|nr:Nif3-like dinuclear metal center hexameric protein [Prevotellaceae bacterium]
MTVKDICDIIEEFAPIALCESYDNAGLLVGDGQAEISGVLISIDVTEAVLDEAIQKGCNMIVSHHPLIFGGLKRLTGSNEAQRCAAKAIRNNVAIYAAHTNIDSVLQGVSGRMAEKIGLVNTRVLRAKTDILLKLAVFAPLAHAGKVRQALFDAGAGRIGNYDSCSYNIEGKGSFRAGEGTNPFVGNKNEIHTEAETRIEVVLPAYLKDKVIRALLQAHPYEEAAYDIYPLKNEWQQAGLGIAGDLPRPEREEDFLRRIKKLFSAGIVRHTALRGKEIKRVALCGGAGSAFLPDAIASEADIYISGDFKYHEFFNAENKIIIADIGHFESEVFTKEIFYEIITKKISTFAVRISDINTNPINYL